MLVATVLEQVLEPASACDTAAVAYSDRGEMGQDRRGRTGGAGQARRSRTGGARQAEHDKRGRTGKAGQDRRG